MNVSLPYSVVIRWSDEDRVYIAHLPEFGSGAKTHGESYIDAAKNAQEVLEMLVESYLSQGKPLPAPEKYEHKGIANVRRSKVSAAIGKRTKQLVK